MRIINRTPHTVTIVQPLCPGCGLRKTASEPGAAGVGSEERCPQCGNPQAGKPGIDGVLVRLAPEPPPIRVEEIEPRPMDGNFGVTIVEALGWSEESTMAAAAEINKAVEDNDGSALVIVSRIVLDALADQRSRAAADRRRTIDRALLGAAAPDTSPASAVRDDENRIIGVRRLVRRTGGHARSRPERHGTIPHAQTRHRR